MRSGRDSRLAKLEAARRLSVPIKQATRKSVALSRLSCNHEKLSRETENNVAHSARVNKTAPAAVMEKSYASNDSMYVLSPYKRRILV